MLLQRGDVCTAQPVCNKNWLKFSLMTYFGAGTVQHFLLYLTYVFIILDIWFGHLNRRRVGIGWHKWVRSLPGWSHYSPTNHSHRDWCYNFLHRFAGMLWSYPRITYLTEVGTLDEAFKVLSWILPLIFIYYIQFAVLLGIIFIVELAVGIAACLYKADLQMVLKDSLEKSITRSSPDDIMAWDNVQRKLMCCGVTGPSDWKLYSRNKTMRASCCIPKFLEEETQDCESNPSLFAHKYNNVSID